MAEKNYLGEFEQEWNSDTETMDAQNEFELENEEDEFEVSADDEMESDDEFESNGEFETDDEFESGDAESEINEEFTDRLYNVITNNQESELEFEQQLNEVLHEIEKDYFWGGLKKRFNKFKKSGLFSSLKKIAMKSPLGDAIKQATAVARGDIKGLVKGLAGQALTSMIPGGAIAKQMLNLEAPVTQSNPRKNAQVINTVAKNAYSNLIDKLGTITSPAQLGQIKSMGQAAFNQAWKRKSSRTPQQVRRIKLRRGQKLVVRVI